MRVGKNNIGPKIRIEPREAGQCLSGVDMSQGSQILRIPAKSRISNMFLCAGASHHSNWAALRGGVLKFAVGRSEPVEIDGFGFVIPTAHTLMDRESFLYVKEKKNGGADIPHKICEGIAAEPLFLVQAGYCHPDQLFLPQGLFIGAVWQETQFSNDVHHLTFRETYYEPIAPGILFLREDRLIPQPLGEKPLNILNLATQVPSQIQINLNDGGRVVLSDGAWLKPICGLEQQL